MTDWREQLKSLGVSIHVIATGAGAGIQSRLWEVPGASAYLSGCSFPYAQDETTELLGFSLERACSEEAAIDIASAAFMKAYRFGGKSPVGVGLTAAVPTDRARRGANRFHTCVITESSILVESHKFAPDRSRSTCDSSCEFHAFRLVREAMGLHHIGIGEDASQPALARFLGRPFFTRTGERLPGRPDTKAALMPGAFNPPHAGHLGIASEVERKHHLPVTFHVTANSPNKPPLTVQDMLKRAKLLRGHDALFTRGESLYIEKARRFPETPLVMGSDALLRMLDPKWGPEVKALLVEFSQLGTTFLVSPRNGLTVDDCFAKTSTDCEFRFMFTELDGAWDVSSTQLRMAP